MCEHGNAASVRVKVPADLSHTGAARWKDCGIDACIAPIVRALQAGGIDMRASCCGHGTAMGRIDLADGRVLLIVPDAPKECVCGIAGWERYIAGPVHHAWCPLTAASRARVCEWCGVPAFLSAKYHRAVCPRLAPLPSDGAA